ncbi:MAG: PAS domain-containing sensor histidine kinase [Kofleriaceae bacterium]
MEKIARWLRDPTQPQPSVEELRHALEHLEGLTAMLDAVDDRFILLDPDGRALFLNRATEQAARGMHGVSREAMIGRSTTTGTASPAYEQYVAGMIAKARDGQTVGGEFLLPLPEGAIWHEHRFHPVSGPNGVEAIAVSSREIHARKQAEGRLALLSKVGMLAATTELDDVLVRAADLAVPELADWSSFEVDGKVTIVHPDPVRRAHLEQSYRSVGAGTHARFVEIDGATTAIAVPFVVMGTPIAVAVFAFGSESGRRHNASDLAIADEVARRASQIVENARLHTELSQALGYRERVMGILGHDLRNPVAAVLSLAATLADRADTPERTAEGLRHIGAAATRMNQMIAAILDFTRIRFHGALTLTHEQFDLAVLARSIVEELRVTHPARTIELAVRGELRGRWDASRLGQVIANLLDNALAHGTRDTPVSIELDRDRDQIVLEVTNHGPRIPPEVIGKLFEPFWQAAPKARGLGLGLLIAQQIVHAHGGEIAVRSETGRTTFTVRLGINQG